MKGKAEREKGMGERQREWMAAVWGVVLASVVVGCATPAPVKVAEAPSASAATGAAAASPSASAAIGAKTAAVARPGDRDRDGFRDEDDFCPDAAEDQDDCDDEDGCPDPDNDGDGVPDAVDRCPNDTHWPVGSDGCRTPPPPNKFVMEGGGDECYFPLDAIYFRKNRQKIESEGRLVLDAIALGLRHCNVILILEVHGRNGDNERSPELAIERAEAVRADLIAHGVEARRLQVVADGVPVEVEPDNPRQIRGVEFRVTRRLSCERT